VERKKKGVHSTKTTVSRRKGHGPKKKWYRDREGERKESPDKPKGHITNAEKKKGAKLGRVDKRQTGQTQRTRYKKLVTSGRTEGSEPGKRARPEEIKREKKKQQKQRD